MRRQARQEAQAVALRVAQQEDSGNESQPLLPSEELERLLEEEDEAPEETAGRNTQSLTACCPAAAQRCFPSCHSAHNSWLQLQCRHGCLRLCSASCCCRSLCSSSLCQYANGRSHSSSRF